MGHPSTAMLEAGLDEIRAAPANDGRVELIVRRPGIDEREIVAEVVLDLENGVVGDTWRVRPSPKMPDGVPHPDKQVTLMSARVAQLLAGHRERWSLAGDQIYVDLDISEANLPPGTRITVGSAAIEVTDQPHTGCAKFAARFGTEALRFVNSPEGRALRLRGMNTKVVQAGAVRVGDLVRRLGSE